jgi:MFS family permease
MIRRKYFVSSLFLVLCVMGFFAILSSTMSKDPVLKPFAQLIGTPTQLQGIIAAASTIPGILVSLPAASLSDVFGRRKILLFATFVFASAPFLYLFVSTWWELFLARFYHGFATAVFVPVAEATVAEHFPTKRGERISLFSSVTYVGRAIAPSLGGVFLGGTTLATLTFANVHSLYLAVGVAGVTAFIVTILFLTESKQTISQKERNERVTKHVLNGWSNLFKNRKVAVLSLVQASQYYVFGGAEFYLVGYLTAVVNLNLGVVGAILSSQIVALIITRPIIGRVSDRTGRRAPIITGAVVSAAFMLAIPHVTQVAALFLLSVGYGIGFAMVISATSPFICEIAGPTLIGTSLGFLDTTMDVGQTLGPIISGLIAGLFLSNSGAGYTAIFYSFGFLLLATCIIFILSKMQNSKQTCNIANGQEQSD